MNVKGGNTSDVKDVLQTVVHAFLRLKNVNKGLNYKQRCIFTHQNVSASDASEQMQDERHDLVTTLNDMTLSAAEQENIADIVFFNEVIDFNSAKMSHIFQTCGMEIHLWHQQIQVTADVLQRLNIL